MEKICLNCGRKVRHEFCPYCGQRTDVERLDMKHFTIEILQFFTHIESTFFKTSLMMMTQPGQILLEWLKGKRQKYFRPVRFFLTWTTIELLCNRFISHSMNLEPVVSKLVNTSDPEILMTSLQHTQLFYLISLPFSALLGYYLLGRPKFYVFETFVIAFYIYGGSFCLWTFLQLICGFIFQINILSWHFYLIQLGITLVYTFYTLLNLLIKAKSHHIIPRLVVFSIISVFLTAKIFFLCGYGWVHYVSPYYLTMTH